MKDGAADCIFCKIIERKIPAEIVYEDANFLAFLDINPQSAGHTQVISKEHHRYVWDVPNAGAYFEVAKKIALAQRKAFGEDMIWSRIMGDEVPHAHIWVFPAANSEKMKQFDKKDFAGNAAKIKAVL